MSCSIDAPSSVAGMASSMPPATYPPAQAFTSVPTGAVDGAVNGASGGAISSLGGGGTALAGAGAATGPDQLAPLLAQLTDALSRLQAAIAGTTGTAPASTTGGGGPATGACGCGGGSVDQSPMQSPVQLPPDQGPGGKGAHKGRGAKHDGPSGTAKVDVGNADVGKWVTGDTQGLSANLLGRLAALGERMGEKVDVTSGHRTYEEQKRLYEKYQAGQGNLAAPPGRSNHESGDAADAKIGGTSLASNAKAKQVAHELGLHFPVDGEPWHVEVK